MVRGSPSIFNMPSVQTEIGVLVNVTVESQDTQQTRQPVFFWSRQGYSIEAVKRGWAGSQVCDRYRAKVLSVVSDRKQSHSKVPINNAEVESDAYFAANIYLELMLPVENTRQETSLLRFR